jgi:hypothetical protein
MICIAPCSGLARADFYFRCFPIAGCQQRYFASWTMYRDTFRTRRKPLIVVRKIADKS